MNKFLVSSGLLKSELDKIQKEEYIDYIQLRDDVLFIKTNMRTIHIGGKIIEKNGDINGEYYWRDLRDALAFVAEQPITLIFGANLSITFQF